MKGGRRREEGREEERRDEGREEEGRDEGRRRREEGREEERRRGEGLLCLVSSGSDVRLPSGSPLAHAAIACKGAK